MKTLTDYVSTHGGQSACAKLFGVTQAAVSTWLSGKKQPEPITAVLIERVSEGAVTRQELRPHDYWLIWPDLTTPDKNQIHSIHSIDA